MRTILLIPGMWSHPGAVKPLKEALERNGHQVILATLPGQNAEQPFNPAESGRSSWADRVAAVNSVIDGLPPASLPLLIGESTGGLIAQIVASQRKTGPLVLLNSPAPESMLRCLPFLLFSFLKQIFGRSSQRAFREMNFPTFRRENTGIDASRVTAPMLIVSGAKDWIVPRSASLSLFRLYPQADYQRFAMSGHWIFEEESSERIFRDIADWIEALEESMSPALPTIAGEITGRRGLHHQAPSLTKLPPVAIPAAKATRPAWRFTGPRKVRKGARIMAE
ncbi:MAG TPA: alpha/beta fold hydrolase [Verrucomicrobiales bacterium]|mgnify:CR=1 FL=1|nr:alpha/beta fold hydrolase [Verrucomicrobiales bacterium]